MSESQLKSIIAQVLGIELQDLPNFPSSFTSIPDVEIVEIDEIRYYLQNQHLITDQSIAGIVTGQKIMYQTNCMQNFALSEAEDVNASFAQRWSEYIQQLEKILNQVKYRRSQNYEYNMIMPPHQQILELQQQCWLLTSEYYGPTKANLSCFYQYFVRMCEVANVTRYAYAQITKYLSIDNYAAHFDLQQRKQFILEHDMQFVRPYYSFGGIQTRGRTDIDATSIANTFYYKDARQQLYLNYCKKYILELFRDGSYGQPLEDYGQLPAQQKQLLWKLIQEHYPSDSTKNSCSIFFQFAEFCNNNPGSCFKHLPEDMFEVNNISSHLLHKIIKFAGLSCGALLMLDRCATENWTPKRYMVASWARQYSLLNLRNAGTLEHMRICPNEMPYASAHGLSLCGDGLLEGLEEHESWQYSWNSPVDVREEVDNNARDIEKIFRELKIIAPHPGDNILPGEALLNIFQNTVAYSTQSSQHTHISLGTIELYPIYMLSAFSTIFVPSLNATVSLVQVGHDLDAMFLRIQFSSLDNEAVIKFLIELYHDMYAHFFGSDNVDLFLQLFPTNSGEYAFIFEPHASLLKLESGEFMSNETHEITIRKPFWFIPQGENIFPFPAGSELISGLEFLRKFYDSTRKRGVNAYITDYISRLP